MLPICVFCNPKPAVTKFSPGRVVCYWTTWKHLFYCMNFIVRLEIFTPFPTKISLLKLIQLVKMKLYPNMISRQDEMHLKWQLTVFNSFVIEKEEHMSERLFFAYCILLYFRKWYVHLCIYDTAAFTWYARLLTCMFFVLFFVDFSISDHLLALVRCASLSH